MKNNDIIDLVQDSEGAYVPHMERHVEKPVKRQKRQKLPAEELLEGINEGKKVVNEIFKAFGVI